MGEAREKEKQVKSVEKQLAETSARVARAVIAVIDTLAQRGGAFRGEEFATIGGLRDQCTHLVNLAETVDSKAA